MEDELDKLLSDGVISFAKFLKYAAPIVLVVKSDGKTRICSDYKLTFNKSARVDKHIHYTKQMIYFCHCQVAQSLVNWI